MAGLASELPAIRRSYSNAGLDPLDLQRRVLPTDVIVSFDFFPLRTRLSGGPADNVFLHLFAFNSGLADGGRRDRQYGRC